MGVNANPVGWFEIPVTDMARARAFYENVFHFELAERAHGNVRMAWFPMTPDIPGSPGSLIQGEGYVPSRDGVLVYFTAPDMAAMLDRVRENNGTVLLDKTSIGEYGYIALILDSEGNRIGLHCRN